MAGHSRSKNGVASLAYVPAIHVFRLWPQSKTWMPGSRLRQGYAGATNSLGPPEALAKAASPGMTTESVAPRVLKDRIAAWP
jgi:hypothetical protein